MSRIPKLGEKVSIWLEGEVKCIEKTDVMPEGIRITIKNKDNSICMVPLKSIEPKE